MSSLNSDFTNLRVHSHFSLMRAVPSVDDLVARATASGHRALALTDHNLLAGAVDFDRACRQAGLKPLLGLTVDLALPPDEVRPDAFEPLGELTLLARNRAGYRTLCRLSSALQTMPATTPALTWQSLRDDHAGVVCLTGGRKGWLERFLRAGNAPAARRHLSRLAGLFGEACFLSVSDALLSPESEPLLASLLQTARGFGVRAVAVRPTYTLNRDDEPLLPLMAAIRHNERLESVPDNDLPGYGEPGVSTVWLDSEALKTVFSDHPDMLAMTGVVVDLVEESSSLPDGSALWPRVPTQDGRSIDTELQVQAEAGLHDRFAAPISQFTLARLERETAVIQQSGFAPFFLLVADIVRFARGAGIPVSTRGSVANSLVAYCLDITTVDPVAHDLLFERFLNPARRTLPDIDLDFCSRRRDEVLDYIRATYGADRVALVATINTLQPRSAIRETGKAYGLDGAALKRLARRLPRGWHPDPRRRQRDALDEALSRGASDTEREILTQGYRLVGMPAHLGIHPGGLVITPGPLTDYVPVYLAAKGFITTQYEHGDVESIGLPKIDLLGIRALTVMAETVDLVRQKADPAFALEDIPLADTVSGDMLAAGDTIGVFQCESDGARRTLRQLQARTVAELADASAFFKPGPASGGMASAFVRRYRGEEQVTYLHPSLKPILGRTKGVLLFQEQVLRLATEIAGLGWAEADQLRRGMSKFEAARIERLAEAFIVGCCRPPPEGPGMTRRQATTLWGQVLPFAGYGFNQGHATAYADVSYRSAYLKAHWPAEFLCARLAVGGGFHHPAIYMAEARRLGIEVRPPHINYSSRQFTLDYEPEPHGEARTVLWMGLGQVHGLRRQSIKAVIHGRRAAPYQSAAALLSQVNLRPAEIQSLIRCGALDGLGESRSAMLEQAQAIARGGSSRQLAFDFAVATTAASETAAQQLAWEMDILGLPVATTPLEGLPLPSETRTLGELSAQVDRDVTICAYRLPGWTGSRSIYFSDGIDYISVQLSKRVVEEAPVPRAWVPFTLTGRWIEDRFSGGWFQAQAMKPLLPVEETA